MGFYNTLSTFMCILFVLQVTLATDLTDVVGKVVDENKHDPWNIKVPDRPQLIDNGGLIARPEMLKAEREKLLSDSQIAEAKKFSSLLMPGPQIVSNDEANETSVADIGGETGSDNTEKLSDKQIAVAKDFGSLIMPGHQIVTDTDNDAIETTVADQETETTTTETKETLPYTEGYNVAEETNSVEDGTITSEGFGELTPKLPVDVAVTQVIDAPDSDQLEDGQHELDGANTGMFTGNEKWFDYNYLANGDESGQDSDSDFESVEAESSESEDDGNGDEESDNRADVPNTDYALATSTPNWWDDSSSSSTTQWWLDSEDVSDGDDDISWDDGDDDDISWDDGDDDISWDDGDDDDDISWDDDAAWYDGDDTESNDDDDDIGMDYTKPLDGYDDDSDYTESGDQDEYYYDSDDSNSTPDEDVLVDASSDADSGFGGDYDFSTEDSSTEDDENQVDSGNYEGDYSNEDSEYSSEVDEDNTEYDSSESDEYPFEYPVEVGDGMLDVGSESSEASSSSDDDESSSDSSESDEDFDEYNDEGYDNYVGNGTTDYPSIYENDDNDDYSETEDSDKLNDYDDAFWDSVFKQMSTTDEVTVTTEATTFDIYDADTDMMLDGSGEANNYNKFNYNDTASMYSQYSLGLLALVISALLFLFLYWNKASVTKYFLSVKKPMPMMPPKYKLRDEEKDLLTHEYA